MNEMLERVAKAIHANNGYDRPDMESQAGWSGAWSALSEKGRDSYRSIARAAIAAMREPTLDMLLETAEHYKALYGERGIPPGQILPWDGAWQKMIDEALK